MTLRWQSTLVSLTAATVFLAASISHADLLQYEPFNYDNDGQGAVMAGRTGGLGFEGEWLDGDGDFEIYTSGSLMYPAGSPLAGSEAGGRLFAQPTGDAGEGVRDIHLDDADNAIGWNRDAVTYISALLRKETTGPENSNEQTQVSLDNGSTAVGARFGIGSNENFYVGISTQPTVYGTRVAEAGETYLLVAKLEASTTADDVMSLWVYGDGDAVPLTDPVTGAEISQTVASGRTLERLRLIYGGNNTGAEFDEIRIGTEWIDVVGIPEPSSVALAALGMLAGVGLLRRRV